MGMELLTEGDTVGSRCEPSLHRCVASAPQSDGPRCMPRLHLALLLVSRDAFDRADNVAPGQLW